MRGRPAGEIINNAEGSVQKRGAACCRTRPRLLPLQHEWARRKELLFAAAAAAAMRAAIEDFFARGMGENEQLTFPSLRPFGASDRRAESRSRRRRAQFYSPGKFTTTYCGSRLSLSPLPSVPCSAKRQKAMGQKHYTDGRTASGPLPLALFPSVSCYIP